MNRSPSLAARLGEQLARRWDDAVTPFVGDREGWQIGIQPYRSYGTPERLRYACRVLRETGLGPTTIHDSAWKNLKTAFHRFESDEIPHARLKVFDGHAVRQATTDREGYARGILVQETPATAGWQSVQLALTDVPYGEFRTEPVLAECLVPSSRARFGIISDLDDTVLHSQVTRRWKMVMWAVLHNAYTRVPLPGVGRLYRQLARVEGRDETNPTFYVSSSPWNLYPMLIEFLDAFDLPRGPVLLRDLGLAKGTRIGSHDHKEEKIEHILNTYEDLSFLLLGDSGQHDAAIYSRIVKRFPGRILCSYIRNVGWFDQAMVNDAKQAAEKAGSEFCLVANSKEIESHAKQRGWIAPRDRDARRQKGHRGQTASADSMAHA